jgi:hypothetical protein
MPTICRSFSHQLLAVVVLLACTIVPAASIVPKTVAAIPYGVETTSFLNITVDGPDYIRYQRADDLALQTWTASVSGGSGSYTYQWDISYHKLNSGWTRISETNPATVGIQGTDGNFSLHLRVVSSDGIQGEKWFDVIVDEVIC